MEGCIASPHWKACESCKHLGSHGCKLNIINLSVHPLGDWIICDDYENEQAHAADAESRCKICGQGPEADHSGCMAIAMHR